MRRFRTIPARYVASAFALALVVAPSAFAQSSPCSNVNIAAPVLPATIPFELHNNHVVIRVCRGDTPLSFTLDTGAGTSIFDLETAKSLGIGIGNPFRAGGAGNGTIAAAQITRDSVTLPGSSIRVPIGIAMDFSALNKVSGGSLQGIIGADFMNRYVVALDYRHLEMRLYDHDAFTYSGTGTSVPFRIVGAFIRVNGELVLADGAHLPVDCVVDVGSSLQLALGKPYSTNNHLGDRIGPTIRRLGGRGVGGATEVDVGRIESLHIGDVVVNRPITQLHNDSAGVFSNSVNGDGNIGGDILRHYTVFFDYRARRMIFESHDRTNEPFEADMSGLSMVPAEGGQGLTVDFVVATSPAAKAGVVKNDLITAVDGQLANQQLLESLRTRFRRENEDVSLTVRRNGANVVLRFRTRRLV